MTHVESTHLIPPLTSQRHLFVNTVLEQIHQYFPIIFIDSNHYIAIVDLLHNAFEHNDLQYTYDHAIEWATESNGQPFVFPSDALHSDAEALIAHGGDLESFIKSRQDAMRPDRLNQERLNSWYNDDPNLPLLRIIAEGVPMMVDDNFTPNHTPPPISAKVRKMEPVLSKSHYKNVQSGISLAIPTALLIEFVDINKDNFSLNPMGLTLQRDKVEGRATSNYSFDNHAGGLLNTPQVTEAMKETYGAIHNMQLVDFVDAILKLSRFVNTNDMVL